LKKAVESLFAGSVAGRVQLRYTNYRHVHDGEGRGWITVDKTEVHQFSTLEYYVESNKLAGAIAINGTTDWKDPDQCEGHREAKTQSDDILLGQGIATQYWYTRGLQSYLQLSVDEALASDNFLHRALAVLDRRLGKRRLRSLELAPTEHELVRHLLAFRRQAEGLTAGDSVA
jgi:hypothetical protein